MQRLGCILPAATLVQLVLQLCAQVYPLPASGHKEGFSEEAVVSPLFDGRVLVHFQFSLTAPHQRHHAVFPLSVAQLVSAVPFNEVELALTQGRWHYHRWDQPLLPVKPAGAELKAVFDRQIPKPSLPPLWSKLSHALGGLFCASLHFVARPETTAVQAITARPYAANSSSDSGSTGVSSITWRPEAAGEHVLYATLPQEASCTENLTPWLKLLPCRDAAGLAQLLKRRDVIFGAEYHSLRVSVKVTRGPNLEPLHSTLTQTLTLVLDPSSSSSSSTRSATQRNTFSDIDLNQLMGTRLQSACPVAQHSRVYMLLPGQVSDQHQQQLVQLPTCPEASQPAGDSKSALFHNAAEAADVGPTAGTAAVADARVTQCCRAPKWKVDLGPGSAGAFTLSPAPDAVAILEPSSYFGLASQDDSSRGSNSIPGSKHIAYVYDLHRTHSSNTADDTGTADTSLPLRLSWSSSTEHGAPEAAAAAGSDASQFDRVRPPYSVHRYIVGSGNLHGGMVLELQATEQPAAEGDVGVCIFQMVPWYVRLWLHTQQLTIDGQVYPLSQHLLLRHISTAQDRARPLVLNLCLKLPASARSISLSAKFTKAFLTAFEHPPDAHRGFDVPAAQVTYLGVLNDYKGIGMDGGSVASWRVPGSTAEAPGRDADKEDDVTNISLMQSLTQLRPQQVYSPGLVVPLAVPDFSMPYNVICLTSTVLAVFFGATLNMLLSRPGEEQRMLAAGRDASKAARRRKKLKLLAVVVIFGNLAVYIDPTVHEAVIDQLKAFGLMQ